MYNQKSYTIRKSRKGDPRFPYRMSRFCQWTTLGVSLLFAAVFFYLLRSSSGTYLSAWFLSLTIAVALLFIISFPRNIVLTSTDLIVYGILEATYINLADIKRIHTVSHRRLRRLIPVIGSYGFGGYFGYYFDIRNLRVIRLFASRLTGLVMVRTVYDDRILLSCEAASELVSMVRRRKTGDPLQEWYGTPEADNEAETPAEEVKTAEPDNTKAKAKRTAKKERPAKPDRKPAKAKAKAKSTKAVKDAGTTGNADASKTVKDTEALKTAENADSIEAVETAEITVAATKAKPKASGKAAADSKAQKKPSKAKKGGSSGKSGGKGARKSKGK